MTKILIVDDDADYLELASTFLMSEGYEVTCVTDGSEALSLLDEEDEEHDLILLDILMPEKKGTEVLKHLRKLDVDIRVAFLTQVERDEFSEDLEVSDYIEKGEVRFRDDFVQRVESNLY